MQEAITMHVIKRALQLNAESNCYQECEKARIALSLASNHIHKQN